MQAIQIQVIEGPCVARQKDHNFTLITMEYQSDDMVGNNAREIRLRRSGYILRSMRSVNRRMRELTNMFPEAATTSDDTDIEEEHSREETNASGGGGGDECERQPS
ncbi:uncharacterized protein LOC135685098 [Rhopilema esculentum]|uniref:uncharacterized protein LOC135685098 n=1 Tax=Rhopilema esculentum TaxID=499914 RepID=UPI0031DA5DEF